MCNKYIKTEFTDFAPRGGELKPRLGSRTTCKNYAETLFFVHAFHHVNGSNVPERPLFKGVLEFSARNQSIASAGEVGIPARTMRSRDFSPWGMLSTVTMETDN